MEDVMHKMTSVNHEHFSSTPGLGMTPSSTSRTDLYILLAVLTVLCLVGTAGNALVLYVFSKKKDELVSTLFIISLAFVDFITCLLVVPCTMYVEFVDFHISDDFFCKSYHFMITSNIPFSALIMVAIAVDRYLCICHPFVRWFTITRARISVALLGVFVTGLGVCVSLMYGIQYSQDAAEQSHAGVPSTPQGEEEGEGFGAITAASIRYAGVTEMNLGVKGIEKQLVAMGGGGGGSVDGGGPTLGPVDDVSERLTEEVLAVTNNTVGFNISNLGDCVNCIAEVNISETTVTVISDLGLSTNADYVDIETVSVWDTIKDNDVTNNLSGVLYNMTTQQDVTQTFHTSVKSSFAPTRNTELLELFTTNVDEDITGAVKSTFSSFGNQDQTSIGTHLTDIGLDHTTALTDEFTPSSGAQCGLTDAILSNEFARLYQKCYTGLFLACLIVVIVLYVLIYQSVLARRTKRQRQKSAALSQVTSQSGVTLSQVTSQTELVASRPSRSVYVKRSVNNGDDQDGMIVNEDRSSYPAGLSSAAVVTMEIDVSVVGPSDVSGVRLSDVSGVGLSDASGRAALVSTAHAPPRVCRRNSSITRDRIANIKTAAMLFVVTVVFIVTYLPAFLMALDFIPSNVVIFYIYFANNAANPVIYSFMNQNFRNDVARLFCKQTPGPAGKGAARHNMGR